MDYYNILGIDKAASAEEIKKAYRKRASECHPDKGGSTEEFQKIEEAYRILSDPQSRHTYDSPPNDPFSKFEQEVNSADLGDMFRSMNQHRNFTRVYKNRDISLTVTVTLEEMLTGKEIFGSLVLPSGREQSLQLKIPAGVVHDDIVSFRGLGDDSISNLPPGDLIVQIAEQPHSIFLRNGTDLILSHDISAFDAMLGTTILVNTIDSKQLKVKVPAGVQPLDMIRCAGHGLPKKNSNSRGGLIVRINIIIPKEIKKSDQQIIAKLATDYPLAYAS